VLWDSVPLVPVIVTVYDPVGVLAVVDVVNVLVNVGVPLVGLTLAVRPAAPGEMLVLRETDWLVPVTRLTVTVAVALLPWTTVPLLGLTLTEKSNVVLAGPKDPTCAMAVTHDDADDEAYSPDSQKVLVLVGVGSVPAPK
jgi:hypothetical protein